MNGSRRGSLRRAQRDETVCGKGHLFRVRRESRVAVNKEGTVAEVYRCRPLKIDDPGVDIAPHALRNVLDSDVVHSLDLKL